MSCHNGAWVDVSSNYSNLFFRVVGNKSSAFGEVQSESLPSIIEEKKTEQNQPGFPDLTSYDFQNFNLTSLSKSIEEFLLKYNKEDLRNYGLRLTKRDVENRPRNMAVKIWKCVKN